jgi:DNA-binding MarR family transcriptional regulator
MAQRTAADLRRSVEDNLVQLGRSISDARDAVAAREDLSPFGAALLLIVREPQAQGVVAETLGLSEPRLSVLATKLVERKLVRRRITKGDKRFRILELTAAGRKVADRIDRAHTALAPLAGLSDAQVKQLDKLLADVTPR